MLDLRINACYENVGFDFLMVVNVVFFVVLANVAQSSRISPTFR